MPRIPLVTEASMTDAQRRVYEAMLSGPRRSPPMGPLAAAMHRPDLAEKWSELGLVLRFNSSFPPRLREFVILLTGGITLYRPRHKRLNSGASRELGFVARCRAPPRMGAWSASCHAVGLLR
jgi:hypothetical protein